MHTRFKNPPRWLVVLFFAGYLLLGLTIYTDFGANMDDPHNIHFGNRWGRYVHTAYTYNHIPGDEKPKPSISDIADEPADTSHTRTHGPVWEIILYNAQRTLLPDNYNDNQTLHLRHCANFLLFYAASIAFYLLCSKVFASRGFGLLGAALLIAHPRIFADSFYNTVDLALLSFIVFSMYTLHRFGEKKTFKSAILHGLACALAVDVRSAALLMPAITGFWMLVDFIRCGDWKIRDQLFKLGCVYAISFFLFMIAFWPFLWINPITHLYEALVGGVLPTDKPSDFLYNFRWIAFTTPPVYLALFVLGIGVMLWSLFNRNIRRMAGFDEALTALLFIVPAIVMPWLASTKLYDGWRHHYFIYPFMVMICVFGVHTMLALSERIAVYARRSAAQFILAALPLAGLLHTAFWMEINHPFQFAYANSFARPHYRLDYWAVSDKQALEYILAHDKRKKVLSIYYDRDIFPSTENQMRLDPKDADRLQSIETSHGADYIIGDYSHLIKRSRNKKLFYVIRVDDTIISAVYKRPKRQKAVD